MTFKPLRDLVLVLPEDAEEKVGSILLPEQHRKSSRRGTVVAVGPKCTLAVGDRVLLATYGGTEIKMAGKIHRLLREEDIPARLEETK